MVAASLFLFGLISAPSHVHRTKSRNSKLAARRPRVRFLTRQFGLLTSHGGRIVSPRLASSSVLFSPDNIYARFNDTCTQSACSLIVLLLPARTIEQFIFNFTEERIQRASFVFHITRGRPRRNKRIIKRFSSLAARFIDSQE